MALAPEVEAIQVSADRAAARLDRVLRVHEELGVPDELARTLRTVGEVELARGRPAAGVLRRSLAIWREVGARLDVARTLARLASADPDGAQALLEEAGYTPETAERGKGALVAMSKSGEACNISIASRPVSAA